MLNFEYYCPTKIIFGKGKENEVGSIVKQYGKKILLHYGGGSVIRSGLLDRVKASLDEEGIEYFELGGVQPNPRLSLINEGIKLVKEHNVDTLAIVNCYNFRSDILKKLKQLETLMVKPKVGVKEREFRRLKTLQRLYLEG
jgi:hypothetical protein